MVERDWGRDCPRLSDLVGTVHSLFEGEAKRQFLQDRIGEAVHAAHVTKDNDTDWHRRRRAYFEDTAVADAGLRDGYKRRLDLVWQVYERRIRESELPSLAPSLLAVEFFDAFPGSVPIDPAFPNPDPSAGNIRIVAWAPAEFLPCHDPTPQFPLPPKNIGRDYRPYEICFALAILHDAHGRFEPFIPDDSLVRWKGAWLIALVTAGPRETDDWVPSLELLLPRVEAELAELSALPTSLAKSKRGAKAKHDAKADTKLADDWAAAKASGANKADFANQKRMRLAELERVLTRVRERKSRAQ